MTPENLSLFGGIQRSGKLGGGLKLSKLSWRMNLQGFKFEYENEPRLCTFSRTGGVATGMNDSRLCYETKEDLWKTLRLESKTVNSARVTVVFQGTQRDNRGASKEGRLEMVGCSGDTCRVVCDTLPGCGTRLCPGCLQVAFLL